MIMASDCLLEIRNLYTEFVTIEGRGLAVDDVSFQAGRGETVAVVGESGCGKTVTALSILRLIPQPPGRIIAGEILLEGRDLLKLSRAEIGAVRGKDIAMIFQEPMTSLNPVLTVGDQIVEAILTHEAVTKKAARARAVNLLDRVGIPDPQKLIDAFPHRMSGGMRQRAMIAMALSCRPKLLIADEPTTALDVTVQAQIMELLQELQRDLEMGLLLITHNLGVVAQMARRVVVMYAGRKVEEGTAEDIFTRPRHPYTRGLLDSMPKPPDVSAEKVVKLREIPGMVPTLFQIPPGCPFRARCEVTLPTCADVKPPCEPISPTHSVACLHPTASPTGAN